MYVCVFSAFREKLPAILLFQGLNRDPQEMSIFIELGNISVRKVPALEAQGHESEL